MWPILFGWQSLNCFLLMSFDRFIERGHCFVFLKEHNENCLNTNNCFNLFQWMKLLLVDLSAWSRKIMSVIYLSRKINETVETSVIVEAFCKLKISIHHRLYVDFFFKFLKYCLCNWFLWFGLPSLMVHGRTEATWLGKPLYFVINLAGLSTSNLYRVNFRQKIVKCVKMFD